MLCDRIIIFNMFNTCEHPITICGSSKRTDTELHSFLEITHVISVPLMWPTGSFSLYQPVSGCPHSNKWFETGSRFYDNEDDSNGNSWSVGHHLAGKLSFIFLKYIECVKMFSSQFFQTFLKFNKII